MSFALAWVASGRTKIARCRDYGAGCETGVLRSGLDDPAIDAELRAAGYGAYVESS